MHPFDLDADEVRQRSVEDDQGMILVKPAVKKRLGVPELVFKEPAIRLRADIPRETEKPDWAKDIVKTMALIQM